MIEIELKGKNTKELKSGVDYIINNPEYESDRETKITHIDFGDGYIIAYSLFDTSSHHWSEYDNIKLHYPLNIIAFKEVITDWYTEQELIYNDDDYQEGEKGFTLEAGKDFGEFKTQNKKVSRSNIAILHLYLREQYYGQ